MFRSRGTLTKNQLVDSIEKMSPALVAKVKNVPLTIVVRMPPSQTVKKITGVMLLALPSSIGLGTMKALSNGRSIGHSSRNPLQPLEEL